MRLEEALKTCRVQRDRVTEERDDLRQQHRGAVSRIERVEGTLLAIASGHPDPVRLARRTLQWEHANARSTIGGQ